MATQTDADDSVTNTKFILNLEEKNFDLKSENLKLISQVDDLKRQLARQLTSLNQLLGYLTKLLSTDLRKNAGKVKNNQVLPRKWRVRNNAKAMLSVITSVIHIYIGSFSKIYMLGTVLKNNNLFINCC